MMRILRTVAAVTLGALLAAPAGPAAQANAEVALRAAMETETVKGDLKAAIEQYKKVAASSDRAIAARALLRLAECYQKLGDSESQRVYERLVRDFADQPDAVAAARARLSGGRGAGTGMVARQLWTTTQAGSQVTITNDGRRAAVVEGAFAGIQLNDLATGQSTRLKVATSAPGGYAEWPVLSPDQSHIVYAYAGPDTQWGYQLRVAAAQSDAQPRAFGNAFRYMNVSGWALDGKSVLVTNFGDRNLAQLAWVSTVDGTAKVLRSLTWQMGRPVLSPDGKFIAYDIHREFGKKDSEIVILSSDGTTESVIAPAPGVNRSPVWARDGSHLVFKSDRSGSFGIWSIAVRNGRGDGPATRLKGDVGDIDLIGFTATAALLYGHRSGTSDIFAMDLDPQTGKVRGDAVRLVDTFVGSNLNPAASSDRKWLAYHRRLEADNQWSQLVVRSLETGGERVFPTVFRYAGMPAWVDDGQSILQVARDVQNDRTVYRVDLKSGDVTRLINSPSLAPGVSVSPDGRKAYGGDTIPERTALEVIDLTSGARTGIAHAGSARNVGASPDGRSIAFVTIESGPPTRGRLYVADADGRNVREILTTDKQNEVPVSVGGVRWSPDSRFIYFLRGNTSLWRIAAAGGEPALVGELGKIPVRSIDVTHDGRQVIFGTGAGFTVEVWALENVLSVAPATR
jgi:Tol biopolymer transport system component